VGQPCAALPELWVAQLTDHRRVYNTEFAFLDGDSQLVIEAYQQAERQIDRRSSSSILNQTAKMRMKCLRPAFWSSLPVKII